MNFIIISSVIFLLVFLRRLIYVKIFRGFDAKERSLIRKRADVLAAFIIFIALNPYLMIAIFNFFAIDETLVAIIYCLIVVVAVSMFIAAIAEEWRALRKSRTAR